MILMLAFTVAFAAGEVAGMAVMWRWLRPRDKPQQLPENVVPFRRDHVRLQAWLQRVAQPVLAGRA